MRFPVRALPLLLCCISVSAGFSQIARPALPDKPGDPLLQKFFSDFNLPAAAEIAEQQFRVASHKAGRCDE
jgi:hypothetical protein